MKFPIEPKTFFSHQCFNAVGHGTFFNGLVFDTSGNNSFCWVYDCGSKSTKRIAQEITCLEDWSQWPKEIDLLVLSHFDNDHVNGVEQLLKSRRVRNLALPYMNIGQSLACAASVGTDPCSASTAVFQIDPSGWLQSRGLSGQVDTILQVQGGPGGDNDPPIDEAAPLPSGRPDVSQRGGDARPDAKGTAAPDHTSANDRIGNTAAAPTLVSWRHTTAVVENGIPLELALFNTTQPDLFRNDARGGLLARRSGKPISIVQEEVDYVLKSYGLHALSCPPRKKWRDALRGVYESNFGSSSQQRNNISLCLLVRPVGEIYPLGFPVHKRTFRAAIPHMVEIKKRAGTLLLGDLRIDRATLGKMRHHFGHARWENLGTVQVPHHGSRNSWESGVAAEFGPDRFIHCVPDSSIHHPHKDVNDDLSVANVHRADYKTSVVSDFFIFA